MFEFVTDKTLTEYEAFNESHPYGHFMQSKKWANLKEAWKWEAILVRDESGAIKGSLAVLIRNLPHLPWTLMYGCRGPVCDPHDKETLDELIAGARVLAKKHKSYVLKLDPDVSIEDKEFIGNLESLGFKNASGDSKNFEGIQPNFVFRLNVEDMHNEKVFSAPPEGEPFDVSVEDTQGEAAIMHFKTDTRTKVRKAIKKGVKVKLVGHEMMPVFAQIMMETGLRDGFVTRPQSYFDKMMDCMGDNARLYMAFYEDKPIAGTLAIYYGDKVWYLYGASANGTKEFDVRKLMPNYLLQWLMIQWALEKNCRIYDFRGVSGDLTPDNPLYGLYRFKKDFNGDLVQFVGEYDLVFKPLINFGVNKGETTYRNLRRKRFLKKNKDLDTSKPKNLTGDHRAEQAAEKAKETNETK